MYCTVLHCGAASCCNNAVCMLYVCMYRLICKTTFIVIHDQSIIHRTTAMLMSKGCLRAGK